MKIAKFMLVIWIVYLHRFPFHFPVLPVVLTGISVVVTHGPTILCSISWAFAAALSRRSTSVVTVCHPTHAHHRVGDIYYPTCAPVASTWMWSPKLSMCFGVKTSLVVLVVCCIVGSLARCVASASSDVVSRNDTLVVAVASFR